MKIEPQPNIIQLKLESAKAGILATEVRDSAVEFGEVISIGENIKSVKVGDKVFVKSWGLDWSEKDGVKYTFVNIETGALLAIVRE